MTPEETLRHESITLPAPPEPIGAYEPAVRSGDLLYLSGHIAPTSDPRFRGRVGEGVDLDTAQQAAEFVGRQLLSTVKLHAGSLDHVVRPVKLTGFVACGPAFTDHPAVIDAASRVMVKVFGAAGRAARAAVGVASLPKGTCVEIEAVFELKPDAPRKAV